MPSETFHPITINDLLRNNTQSLSVINDHIALITSCQNKLRSDLGPPLSVHLTVANVSSEFLMLYTDSPSWASRLRYNIQNILNIVRQGCGLSDLKSVRIKVVIRNLDNKPVRRIGLLSQNTAQLIEATTRSMKDLRLRNSLSNLARHHTGP